MHKRTLMLWGLSLFLTAPLWRLQTDELVARIHGVVTDPYKAAVPGAQVKAANTDTLVSSTVLTANDGSFNS